jgi:hypothetical protein
MKFTKPGSFQFLTETPARLVAMLGTALDRLKER